MEKILIGDYLSLNLQTRALTRVKDEKKVILGLSPSLCLASLLKANGAVMTHESLLDVGWRQTGIEVTSSSLRVMINQLRRAFLSLQIDNKLEIITVPRIGYRLLISDAGEAESRQSVRVLDLSSSKPEQITPYLSSDKSGSLISRAEEIEPVIESSELQQPKVQSKSDSGSGQRTLIYIIISTMLGLLCTWAVMQLYVSEIEIPVNYKFINPQAISLPKNVKVYTQKNITDSDEKIKATLELWRGFNPSDAINYSFLYLNIGHDQYHYSLFACKKAIEEGNSECKSFVYKTQ